MTKPITPRELDDIKLTQVPEFLYTAINSELSVSPVIGGEINVHLANLRAAVNDQYTNTKDMARDIDRAMIQYRKYGWSIRKSVIDWDDPSPEILFFREAV